MHINMLAIIIYNGFKTNKRRYIFLTLGVLSSIACVISTYYHYTGKYYGNKLTWISWLFSMLFLLIAFAPSWTDIKNKRYSLKNKNSLLFISISLFFFISHFWNFNIAPWGQNGLFDDAAWDIFFAKAHIFTNMPFQAAFFDDVGRISREVIYHYYLIIFFKLFGYNLLVMNVSLIILSFITFIFTCLLVQSIFKKYIVTIFTAIVLNFFPLYFMQTFLGHRYAAAAPFMVSSLYFVYTGFKNKSFFRLSIGAILAALCVDSAVMGKQYLIGLAVTLVLLMIFDFKNIFNQTNWRLLKVFITALVISMIPLIIYTCFNPVYFQHEGNLTRVFFDTYRDKGFEGIKLKYINRFLDVFFAESTYFRWINTDFVTIPYVYYFFLIPGIVIAFLRKRFEIILLAAIPLAGAFIAGCFDMRFLHAVPFFVILMAFTFNFIVELTKNKKLNQYIPKYTLTFVIIIVSLVGLIPCMTYINKISGNPNSVRLLPQRDVGISRFVRDITAGVTDPSPNLRRNELVKLKGLPEPGFDTFVCQMQGYAITHLFLQDYDDKKIMSFSDQLPASLLSEEEILNSNKNAIMNYQKSNKDLKLVWEVDIKTQGIIEEFRKMNYLGSDQEFTSEIASQGFQLYVLDIKNENIDKFKAKVVDYEYIR